jgi:hypothetical protein
MWFFDLIGQLHHLAYVATHAVHAAPKESRLLAEHMKLVLERFRFE